MSGNTTSTALVFKLPARKQASQSASQALFFIQSKNELFATAKSQSHDQYEEFDQSVGLNCQSHDQYEEFDQSVGLNYFRFWLSRCKDHEILCMRAEALEFMCLFKIYQLLWLELYHHYWRSRLLQDNPARVEMTGISELEKMR